MIEDALSSLRALFFASLLMLSLWLLSWPTATEKLRRFSAAVELHEWLALKERLAHLETDVFDTNPDEVIAEDIEWIQRISPNEEFYPGQMPLVVDLTWPVLQRRTISLAPAGFDQKAMTTNARIYRVVSPAGPAWWNSCYAIFLKDTEEVMQGDEIVEREKRIIGIAPTNCATFKIPKPGIRQARAALRDENHPRRWNELRLLMSKHGFTDELSKLSSRDSALAALQAETDPREPGGGVNVFGVSLNIAQFFSAIGALLAAIAFVMIGPLLALRSATDKTQSSSWVFVVPAARGMWRGILEWTICIATLFWGASPLLILILQFRFYATTEVAWNWLSWIGAGGLFFSSVVFGWAARELWMVRLLSAVKKSAGISKNQKREKHEEGRS
jgi:hypothetical protein